MSEKIELRYEAERRQEMGQVLSGRRFGVGVPVK